MPGSNTSSSTHPPRPTPRQLSKTIPTSGTDSSARKSYSTTKNRRCRRASSTFAVVAAIAAVAETSSAKAIPWQDNNIEYNYNYNSYSSADWVTSSGSGTAVLDFLYPSSYLVHHQQQQLGLRQAVGEAQQRLQFSQPERQQQVRPATSTPSASSPRPSPAVTSSFVTQTVYSPPAVSTSATTTTLATRTSSNNDPRYTPRAVSRPRKRSYRRNLVNNDKSNKNSSGKKYKNRKRSSDDALESITSATASSDEDEEEEEDHYFSGLYTQRIIPDRYELGDDGRWHKVSLWTSCSVCQTHEVDNSDLDSAGTLDQDDDLAVSSSATLTSTSASASSSTSSSSALENVVYPDGWDKPASDSEVYKVPLIIVASLIVAAGISCAVFLAIMWRKRRRRKRKEARKRDLEKMKRAGGRESDDEDDDDGYDGGISREAREKERRKRAFKRGNRSLRSSLVSLRDTANGGEDEVREREKEKAKARFAKANALWKMHAKWIQRRRRGRGIGSTVMGASPNNVSESPASSSSSEEEETTLGGDNTSTVMIASGVSLRRSGSGSERPRATERSENLNQNQNLANEGNQMEVTNSRDVNVATEVRNDGEDGDENSEEGNRDGDGNEEEEEVRGQPPAYVPRREERRRERRDEKRALSLGTGRDGTGYVPSPGDYAPYDSSDSETETDLGLRDRNRRRVRRESEEIDESGSTSMTRATLHVSIDDKRALENMAAYASAPPSFSLRSAAGSAPTAGHDPEVLAPESSSALNVPRVPSWTEIENESELDPVMEYSAEDGIPEYEYEYRKPAPISTPSNSGTGISCVSVEKEKDSGHEDAMCLDSPGAGPGPSTVQARRVRSASTSSTEESSSLGFLPHPPKAVSSLPEDGFAYAPLESLGFEIVPSVSMYPYPSENEADVMAGASAPPLFDDDDDDDVGKVVVEEDVRERIEDGEHVEGSDQNEVLSAVR